CVGVLLPRDPDRVRRRRGDRALACPGVGAALSVLARRPRRAGRRLVGAADARRAAGVGRVRELGKVARIPDARGLSRDAAVGDRARRGAPAGHRAGRRRHGARVRDRTRLGEEVVGTADGRREGARGMSGVAYVIEFLKAIEAEVPPGPGKHHTMNVATDGSEVKGYTDRLWLDVNGVAICIEPNDFERPTGELVLEVRQLVAEVRARAHQFDQATGG